MSIDDSGADAPDDLEILLVHLADNGYADQVGSWMSPDVTNLPITGKQLLGALTEDALADAASEAGLSVQEYADYLAEELPASWTV